MHDLATLIKQLGLQLGFQKTCIAAINLEQAEVHFEQWLELGRHGEMTYMAAHGRKRSRPERLIPGTLRVITVQMNYLPQSQQQAAAVLDTPAQAYLSRYALGRDYHKLIRRRLQLLADKITQHIGQFGYRVFCDSAPVLERALAEKSGLGWIGKHTNLINRTHGSWFFLGELYTELPLPTDAAASQHCGDCSACIDICPTQAIVAPYQLDARRCISYLTIELHGSIPLDLRPLLGNRVYGCDDCQLVCPWNRFAQISVEIDFQPRHNLDNIQLLQLFAWDESTFKQKTEGSAMRRIGYHRLLRNVAVALGNGSSTTAVITALRKRAKHPEDLVREHSLWALERLATRSNQLP